MSAKAQPAQTAPMEPIEARNVTRYYVWDKVIRTGHWINVASLATLIFTGFYIGGPWYRPTVDEPYGASVMATMRNLHFVAGVVFAMNGLFRIYWFAAGRTYRQWFDAHVWQADFWREVWWKMRDYASLRYVESEATTLHHNALAALAYSLTFLACAFLSLTGFAMAGRINPGGFLDALFGWVIPPLGGELNVRMLHRLAMWVIIGFSIYHICFVIYYEIFTERGLVSSIITGFKTRPANWKQNLKPWKKE
ncbi:MAG TPA: Ni/Fe-hydrogenase, b-type cytochrome subunit [Blastocatellia bacterium]|jgi:Ni/Fe-hydrogenase 1 B-type cytochrome subunit